MFFFLMYKVFINKNIRKYELLLNFRYKSVYFLNCILVLKVFWRLCSVRFIVYG